ncbi:hypothetical protein [Streptomyces sp. 4R-3d]|uniref:hypothetical protein n=1 Tax=Streptomyces sp. 4R-3d TaxID=2559605 RepID=UPI0010719AED|nr:hypothetical protein [Streptomyces sp. 4R-3d]TFI30128.1 hypothetical protein E4P36_05100 [Streptomyces sp. 4R-3d]
MTDSVDATLDLLNEQLRAKSDLAERYTAVRDVEKKVKAAVTLHLQEIAKGLKSEGRTWPQVGEIMGGVTYQRAHQISKGE